MHRWGWSFGVALCGLLAACERTPSPAPAPPPGPAVYEVRGVLKRADAITGRAVIAHEDIPGYMPAMTMDFPVAHPAELASLEPGDMLTFRLVVSDTRSAVEQLHKVGHGPVPVENRDVPGLPPRGTPLPDAALVDERGHPFRLSEFKGRAVALTFIFTRCPLPDFCPLMSNHFGAVRRELTASAGSEDWHLLSITVDPTYDTPERLAEYAKGYRPDPAHWSFATGDAAEIQKLAGFFGLSALREGASLDHNLRTVVVDRGGRVRTIFTGNDWKPRELVDEMKWALEER